MIEASIVAVSGAILCTSGHRTLENLAALWVQVAKRNGMPIAILNFGVLICFQKNFFWQEAIFSVLEIKAVRVHLHHPSSREDFDNLPLDYGGVVVLVVNLYRVKI